MNISLEYLEQCATKTGYAIAALDKVAQLGELAGEIARHPVLAHALALKGGTAFNLCFEKPPARLSVDLDYNYIGHVERDAMAADRPRIEEAVVNLAQRLQSAAAPGQILLTAAAYQRVRDHVEARQLPPIEAKGFSEPVPAYELLGLK